MGNKCSLCMNCKFKETNNTMPPCNFCEDCSSFRLRPPKQGPDSICKTCRYRLWPRANGHCSTCDAYGSSYVHYPIKEKRKNSMERSISDIYCKKCENNSYACQECVMDISYDQYSVPTKFKSKNTIKIPDEKMYNYNWIADFVDRTGYNSSMVVKIKKIIFSGPATIILWQGGGKTIVKYHKEKGCTYRKDLGVLYCIIKHYMCLDNTKLFHKLLKTIDGFCEESSR